MKKLIPLSVIAIVSTTAVLAGCSAASTPSSDIKSVVDRFLEEDANPTYDVLPGIVEYESGYSEENGSKILVSVLYLEGYEGLSESLDAMKENEVFMTSWTTIEKDFEEIQYNLQQKLEARLREKGFTPDEVDFGIDVMDSETKKQSFFSISDGSTYTDIFVQSN